MVLLDADIAGCVSTWLNNGGTRDTGLLRILHNRARGLGRILPTRDPSCETTPEAMNTAMESSLYS
jgi:hypothetical protein